MVTHVVITETLADGSLKTSSQLLLYRNRGEEEVDIFAASREDELVPAGSQQKPGFKIRRRKILLKQSVLLAKNLTLFF
jgi:biphenyl 2,3-dioxygenase beta subunit